VQRFSIAGPRTAVGTLILVGDTYFTRFTTKRKRK